MAGGGNPLGGLQQGAAALTGAFTALTGSVNAVAGPIAQFVQAINPAIVAEFNRAMRDLNATIGIALMPIMETLTGVVREMIGNLLPVMQSLQPVIRTIAQAIGGALTPVIQAFAGVMTSLMPVFQVFADVIEGGAGLFGDFVLAVRPVIEVVVELGKQLMTFVGSLLGFEDGAKGLFEQLRSGFQMLIKNVILAAATFLKMIGATDTLGALIKGLRPPEQGPRAGIATLQNASMTGDFASISKRLAEQAFVASAFGGKGGPKKTDDWLAELAKTAQDIKDGKGSPMNAMMADMVGVMTGVFEFGKATAEWVQKVAHWVEQVWKKLPSTEEVDDTIGEFFSPMDEKVARDLANMNKAVNESEAEKSRRIRGAGADKRGF